MDEKQTRKDVSILRQKSGEKAKFRKNSEIEKMIFIAKKYLTQRRKDAQTQRFLGAYLLLQAQASGNGF